ncbi:hypothetical protein BURMUCF1_A0309 [Burkholderia multivorans ATCC BAA-247]|nr:hypothetical protein BURMUCF1_A0309 [Burkholderia multivorans ATCC BAA-247]
MIGSIAARSAGAAAIEPSLRGTTQRAPAGERAIAYRPPRAAMRHLPLCRHLGGASKA